VIGEFAVQSTRRHAIIRRLELNMESAMHVSNPLIVIGVIVLPSMVVGLGGCSSASRAAEAPTELKMDDVLRMPLDPEFIADREVIVSVVEIPPHTTMDRHWHPGEEFHYYLEGEVEIAIDGQPSIFGTPGTVGHVPLRAMHTAITRDKGAKIIVFRMHTAGEPVRHLEEAEE
jgi:quercetin dioxygenase-like cupin family protein